MRLIAIIALAFITSACLEQVDFKQNQFVKVLGKEGTSIAERVIELKNGDLMVLGRMGVAAHDLESTGAGFNVNRVEDQGPFIAILDHNGNLKDLRIYPVQDLNLPFIELSDIRNQTTFLDIVELSQGGYAVLAEIRGFDYTITLANDTISNQNEPTNQNSTPILFELDGELNVQSVRSFNGDEDWDQQFLRTTAIMKPISESEIGILFRYKVTLEEHPVGYSMYVLDHQLNTTAYENFDQSLKFGYDFDVNQSGDIAVLGLEREFDVPVTDYINVYEFGNGDLTASEHKIRIDDDGEELVSVNRNEHFIRALPDGNYGIIYTDPGYEIRMAIWNPETDEVTSVEIDNTQSFSDFIRAPRAVHVMDNGDLLAYIINIPNTGGSISGHLYRLSPEGQIVFSRQIEGTPGDVVELADGGIMLVTNDQYNGLLQRIHVIKLDAHGNLH